MLNLEGKKIILGSNSPRRKELLTGLGVDFTVDTGNTFEEPREPDRDPVVFDSLPKENIEYYIDTYKPYDKAGAYAIQEWIGYTGIREIRGSYYNVMGLPVNRLWKELSAFTED